MIGGNTTALLQISTGTGKNEIGEAVQEWKTAQELTGFLDLSSGDSKRTIYNAKVQESTHIFIADYEKIADTVKAENSRMLIDGQSYDVTLIDDPMGLHAHLEIYLKYTGAQ